MAIKLRSTPQVSSSNCSSRSSSSDGITATKKARCRLPLHLHFSGLSLTGSSTTSRATGSSRNRNRHCGSCKHLAKELSLIFTTVDKKAFRQLLALHGTGVARNVLISVATLVAQGNSHHIYYQQLSITERDTREASFEALAHFLLTKEPSFYHTQLACLRICLNGDSSHELDESTLRACLFFLRYPHSDCPLLHHTLLWELCIHCRHIPRPTRGDVVAHTLFATAQSLARHLRGSAVPLLVHALDTIEQGLKQHVITPQPTLLTTKAGVVTLTYTNAAKRASGQLCNTAKYTVHGIRDISTRGILYAAKTFEQENLGTTLVPHERCRHFLVAVGTVGLAALGAAAIIGEAVLDCTKEVAQKVGDVTANVVAYTYGAAAGQAVQDATDTTGNLIQTVRYVVFLESAAKGIAKNTGKVVTQPLVMDSTKSAAQRAVQKLKSADASSGHDDTLEEHEKAPRFNGLVEATELSIQSLIVPLVFFWS